MNTNGPDTGLAYAFVNEAPNYTVDETALSSMGENSYAQDPIGAGPVQGRLQRCSSSLTVTKNGGYWEKGHPLLSASPGRTSALTKVRSLRCRPAKTRWQPA